MWSTEVIKSKLFPNILKLVSNIKCITPLGKSSSTKETEGEREGGEREKRMRLNENLRNADDVASPLFYPYHKIMLGIYFRAGI